jgi:ribosomal-protein-alanine N-acetyltransferase
MNPVVFPEIHSPRLRLRAIGHADVPVIFRLYADPRVMEFRGEPVFTSEKQAEKLIFSWRRLFALGNGIRWGIEERESGELIGSLGFKSLLHQHRRADLGYELHPARWNRGIMTEAVGAVVKYGFEQMNLHSIEANITPGHVASERVLEKLGFRAEALHRENYFYEHWWDSGIWSLRRS